MLKNNIESSLQLKKKTSNYPRYLLSRAFIEPINSILLYFLTFLQFIFIASILIFQKQTPNSFNEFIGSLTLQILQTLVNQVEIILILSVLGVMIMLKLTILQGAIQSMIICKFAVILFNIYILVSVPLNYLWLMRLKSIYLGQNQKGYTTQTIIGFVMIIICNVIAFFYIKKNFIPLRKGNRRWKMDNMEQAYFYVINLARTYVFALDGIYPGTILWGAFVEIYHRNYYHSLKTPTPQPYNIILQNRSNLLLSVHLLIFLDLINKQEVGLSLWIVLIFLSVLLNVIQCISSKLEQIRIPICEAPIYEHYDCYFSLKQQLQIDQRSRKNSRGLVQHHKFMCKMPKCFIREWSPDSKGIDLKVLVNIVEEIINSRKDESIQNKFYYQLWRSQIGKSYSFDKFQNLSDSQQYVSTYPVHAQQEITESEDKQVQQKDFFMELEYISNQFQTLYLEITKITPRTDIILNTGFLLQKSVKKLNMVFMKLLKSKNIKIETANIYIKFLKFFVNSDQMDEMMISSIQNNQTNNINNIHEFYQPSIHISADDGSIITVNKEFMKLFKLNTIEEAKKQNPLVNFYPEVTVKQLIEHYKKEPLRPYLTLFKRNKNIRQRKIKKFRDTAQETLYKFIRQSSNQIYMLAKVLIQPKDYNGAKILILALQTSRGSDKQAFIHLSSQFNIECLTKQFINYTVNSQQIHSIDICQVYETTISPILKSRIKNRKTFATSSLKHPNMIFKIKILKQEQKCYIISVQAQLKEKNIYVDSSKKERQQLRFYKRKGIYLERSQFYFQFNYQQDQQKQNQVVLRGMLLMPEAIVNTSFDKSFLNHFIEIKPQTSSINYAEDIRTYRLIGEDIYNVDLEDREAYNQQFMEHQVEIPVKKQRIQGIDIKYADLYSSLAFFVSLLMILLSISLVCTESTQGIVFEGSIKSQRIERFKINMNRIASVIRDVAQYESVGKNWVKDISQAYYNIASEKTYIFNSTQRQIILGKQKYFVNLNQASQIVLSHVYQIIANQQKDTLASLHLIIVKFIKELNDQKNTLYLSMEQSMSQFSRSKFIWTLVMIFFTVLYYIFLPCACVWIVKEIREEMNGFSMISDEQAEFYVENAEILKNTVKNMQIMNDSKDFLEPNREFRSRKRAKKMIIGNKLKQSTRILGFMGLCAGIFIFWYFYQQCLAGFNKATDFLVQSKTLTGIYSQLGQISNEMYFGQIHLRQEFSRLKNHLIMIQQHRKLLSGSSTFSDELTDEIERILFSTDCLGGTVLNCSNLMPGFKVTNPFKIGVFIYLNYMYLELRRNITQVYGVTGIYSQIFAQIFINMTKKLETESKILDTQLYNSILNRNKLVVMINVFYLLIAFLAITHLKSRVDHARSLINFLSLDEASLIKKKQKYKSQYSLTSLSSEDTGLKNDPDNHSLQQQILSFTSN